MRTLQVETPFRTNTRPTNCRQPQFPMARIRPVILVAASEREWINHDTTPSSAVIRKGHGPDAFFIAFVCLETRSIPVFWQIVLEA